MDNITELFPKATETQAEPNFNYTIRTKTGDTVTQTGYIVVNSLFAAVCRGEGVIYWMRPFEDIAEIVNNGPASTTVN